MRKKHRRSGASAGNHAENEFNNRCYELAVAESHKFR